MENFKPNLEYKDFGIEIMISQHEELPMLLYARVGIDGKIYRCPLMTDMDGVIYFNWDGHRIDLKDCTITNGVRIYDDVPKVAKEVWESAMPKFKGATGKVIITSTPLGGSRFYEMFKEKNNE